ncbi:MAG: RHS repeat-associated core domain-containing protein, partial [Bacillota bacterium]
LFGNITSQKRGGATYGTFAYDKLSRIKEETIQGNTRQYAYDRRGNRQAYANAPADSTRSYELKHDLLNRLTEYKDDKGTTTYTYYPGGLRATKQQTGTVTDTTHYVYLNGQVIEELTQDGRVKARNVFGNQLIWRKDFTTNQEGTYYYNSHGDVVKIKGPSGNVLNTYEYDIWGNLLADKVKEAMPNPFAYAGEMYDKESGFYYLRARYYDPKMGRFVSEDTVKGQVDNPLSLNRYTYVHNNPLRFFDPTGNHAVTWKGSHRNRAVDKILLFTPSWWEEMVYSVGKSAAKSSSSKEKASQEAFSFIGNKVAEEYFQRTVWDMKATERGNLIEAFLAVSDNEYEDWDHVGRLNNGYFPVIDFFDNEDTVVSLKTMDTSSYSKEMMYTQLSMYVYELRDANIYVDGAYLELENRILDIRVKAGQQDTIDIEELKTRTKYPGIIIKVEEF